jgi:uncharacterized membrane protein
VIAGLVSMPFLAGIPHGKKLPDIVRFIGHFHPVILHLPIGVFIFVLFQELSAMFGKRNHGDRSSVIFPVFFGAVTAVITFITGFLLFYGQGDDYGSNHIAILHLWTGLIFAVAAVLTFLVKNWTIPINESRIYYRFCLFCTIGIMSFAAHQGATLTHGESYLTRYAPTPIRELLGIRAPKVEVTPKPPKNQFVYPDIIAPILDHRCVQCHKEGKSKGKLRMDSFELMMKGGSDGPIIVPGNAAKSHMIERIELPVDDDDHMPPEGKPAIDSNEVAVIKWWIDSGADPRKSLSEMVIPLPIKKAIAKLAISGLTENRSPENKRSASTKPAAPIAKP